jgi:predicted ABC-type ATPase
VIIIAGPNGAGKSTSARQLLNDALDVRDFVNADVIANGLSAFKPEGVSIQAGRIMLNRLDELAKHRASFAFETTLATRSFAPRIGNLKRVGYDFHLIYLWLPSAELAIARVQQRVQQKGHHVPDDVVRRRYQKGLRNFFDLYRPLATSVRLYNSADLSGPRRISEGEIGRDFGISAQGEFDHGT